MLNGLVFLGSVVLVVLAGLLLVLAIPTSDNR